MKVKSVLALILVFALLLSVPAFALQDRASDQISRHDIKITPQEGRIVVKTSIYGNGFMNKLGCESIYFYEQYGSAWISDEWLLEDDYNMYNTNSVGYAANHYFDSEPSVRYMIVITLFAENDEGRDTIEETFYVTGK